LEYFLIVKSSTDPAPEADGFNFARESENDLMYPGIFTLKKSVIQAVNLEVLPNLEMIQFPNLDSAAFVTKSETFAPIVVALERIPFRNLTTSTEAVLAAEIAVELAPLIIPSLTVEIKPFILVANSCIGPTKARDPRVTRPEITDEAAVGRSFSAADSKK